VTEPELTPVEATELWRVFRDRRCEHCGGAHARVCPKVKRLEFHQNGNIQSVEFWPPGQWPEDHVQWPEDLPDEPEGPAG
jgi:hypothetical protein